MHSHVPVVKVLRWHSYPVMEKIFCTFCSKWTNKPADKDTMILNLFDDLNSNLLLCILLMFTHIWIIVKNTLICDMVDILWCIMRSCFPSFFFNKYNNFIFDHMLYDQLCLSFCCIKRNDFWIITIKIKQCWPFVFILAPFLNERSIWYT